MSETSPFFVLMGSSMGSFLMSFIGESSGKNANHKVFTSFKRVKWREFFAEMTSFS